MNEVIRWLGGASVLAVPIASDCVDGFLAAFWRRPEAYLDEEVRAGISSFPVMPPTLLNDGLKRLAADLASSAWLARYGELRNREELDCGYRLLVAEVR